MSEFFSILRHLLPTGRAWRLTVDKTLRQFIGAISTVGDDVKTAVQQMYLGKFPDETDDLLRYEIQFGLNGANLTETERRARVLGAWRSVGGQSPHYLQDILQFSGFDVYTHDWWVPGSEPAIGTNGAGTVRNPLTYLRPNYIGPLSGTGLGYPLVNKLEVFETAYIAECGEPDAECGEPEAEAGNTLFAVGSSVDYTIPNDPTLWPYFVYIGGETFGDLVQIPEERKDEFEELCLRICPNHLWLGMLVEYI